MSSKGPDPTLENLQVSLTRDIFLRQLLRELTGALEDVVGVGEASGFISIVGQSVGEWLNGDYRRELAVPTLSADQVAAVLVDLKRRIEGRFSIVDADDEKIVLRNEACPFGMRVRDRPSLCMMTSNVFGVIAAENLGYAKVVLEKTIARGDEGCFVTVHLRQDAETGEDEGNEYFRS